MSGTRFDRIAVGLARFAIGGLLLALPSAFFLVQTFTEEWSSQPNMFGGDVWGLRFNFALFFGLGLAVMFAPREWFYLTGRPRRRPRLP